MILGEVFGLARICASLVVNRKFLLGMIGLSVFTTRLRPNVFEDRHGESRRGIL